MPKLAQKHLAQAPLPVKALARLQLTLQPHLRVQRLVLALAVAQQVRAQLAAWVWVPSQWVLPLLALQ